MFLFLKCFILCPDGILPVGLHGNGGSISQSLHRHEYHLGLKFNSAKKRACAWWRKQGLAPFYMEASHDKVQFSEPIAAQPAWSQHCENGCIKMPCNHMAQLNTYIEQPTSDSLPPPQKGIGLHYIMAPQLHIRMTLSITSKFLNAWGHMQD